MEGLFYKTVFVNRYDIVRWQVTSFLFITSNTEGFTK